MSLFKSAVMTAITALSPVVGKGLGTAFAVAGYADAATKGLGRVAGAYQAIGDDHFAKGYLQNTLVFSVKGEYGTDYAFFWPDNFGAAIGIMDGNDSGDMYYIEVADSQFKTARYDRFLVYAKFGLASSISHSKAIKVIAELKKRSGTVDSKQMDDFLRAVVTPNVPSGFRSSGGGGVASRAM